MKSAIRLAFSIKYLIIGVFVLSIPHAIGAGFGTFEKPFAADSLWNSYPVEPVLSDYQIPPASGYTPAVQTGNYSTGFFLAKYTDGPVTVKAETPSKGLADVDAETYVPSVRIPHWPENVVPAAGSDGHADIFDPSTGIIHSFFHLRNVNGEWTASVYAWAKINGTGWGDPAQWYKGVRATGVPAVAGLIRKHEIEDGDTMYRHALTMSLATSALVKYGYYIYPATASDYLGRWNNKGSIPEGSLMMLPNSFNVDSLKTPELRKVASTLKTYGAYVTDTNNGVPFVIYVENGSGFNLHKNGWNSAAASDLWAISKAMRQVVAAKNWVDGNGKPFTPAKNLNLLSMRGPWTLKLNEDGSIPEAELGVYYPYYQAVMFGKTTAPVVQVKTLDKLSRVTWANPQIDKVYHLVAYAANGAKFRFQILDKLTNEITFDSGDMINNQKMDFKWPTQDYKAIITVTSGVGNGSWARGTINENIPYQPLK